MKKLVFLLFIFSLFLLAFAKVGSIADKKIVFEQTSDSTFVAGKEVCISFKSSSKIEKPVLFISHSYGKTILKCLNKNGMYRFSIPANYTRKTGELSWNLIQKNEIVLKGAIAILPDDHSKTVVENYLGPRGISAGGKEFVMLATIPTDGFDNPKPDHTNVLVKHQFLGKIQTKNLETKNFISWYRLYSPNKSGKLLISSECDAVSTKETEVEIYPSLPTNFHIYFDRNHDFADGNQITTFTTSTIKDQFNNNVSDGSLINFIIKTNKNTVLKTFGTTINGVATAKILHPDHPNVYRVTGYVTGIAKSNTLTLNYKPIIADFNYTFKNKNSSLVVGCIKSFMNQIIPDGIKVTLKVFYKNKQIDTYIEDTSKGFATFTIKPSVHEKGDYQFEISTLGITKKTASIHYEQ